MVIVTYILAAVILLGLCIFVHELGHLLGGKIVGIKAKVFSIGYGKGIVKKEIGDTTYQITLIPFGGYCKFYGEDPREKRKGKDFEFLSAHPLKRVLVVIMGPLFNLFFGIILFFILNLIGYTTETSSVYIPTFYKSGEYISPAYQAGIRSGDRIIEINGKEIHSFSDLQIEVLFSEGIPLNIKVDRDEKILDFTVNPKKYDEKGHYAIGVIPYGERVLVMGTLEEDVASDAGIKRFDEIKSINGKLIKTPEEFTKYIRSNAGQEVNLQVIRGSDAIDIKLNPRLKETLSIYQFSDSRFKAEKFDIIIDRMDILKKTIKDRKLKINNITVASFTEFKDIILRNSNRLIKIENAGGIYYGICKYEGYGFIGVETAISPKMIDVKYGIFGGMIRAFFEPFEFIVINIKAMSMLFTGRLNVRENISGPIRIAKFAGDVAYYKGISAFILLMAKISVILMVMNLLPIPVVDGSFIIFFLFEAIRGKPIDEKVMEKIQFVGIAILILLGGFVILNDLSFLPFFQNLFK